MSQEHFIISKKDLGDIYLLLLSGNYSSRSAVVMMLLSEPNLERPDPSNIYDDCFLLSLESDAVDSIITAAQSTYVDPNLAVLVRHSLTPGLASRDADS